MARRARTRASAQRASRPARSARRVSSGHSDSPKRPLRIRARPRQGAPRARDGSPRSAGPTLGSQPRDAVSQQRGGEQDDDRRRDCYRVSFEPYSSLLEQALGALAGHDEQNQSQREREQGDDREKEPVDDVLGGAR